MVCYGDAIITFSVTLSTVNSLCALVNSSGKSDEWAGTGKTAGREKLAVLTDFQNARTRFDPGEDWWELLHFTCWPDSSQARFRARAVNGAAMVESVLNDFCKLLQ